MQEQETLILTRRTARAFLYGSLGTFGIFVLTFLLLPSLLTDANAAQTVSANTGWDPVSLTIDPDYGNGSISDEGHGDVDFGTLAPQENRGNSKGAMRVEKKTIGVTSTGKYYSVYLSTAATETDLVNGLRLSTDSGITIPAINGTWDSPATFTDAGWGYAVPTKTDIFTTPFSATTYASNYNSTLDTLGVPLTYDSNAANYNQGTWAAVPTYQEPQQIWEAEVANTAGFSPVAGSTNQAKSIFDVYYAVMVDTDILAGTYSNNIVYTALASAQGIDTASKNISRNKSIVAAGDTEVLNFDLAQSVEGVLSQSDFHVFLVPHDVTASTGSNYTVDSTILSAVSDDNGKTIKANPDYKECTIGSGTSDFVLGDNGAVIRCTMPDPGTIITTGADWTGAYDFWVFVPRYNISYISKYTRASNEVATVYYAGLQSGNPENGGTTKFITSMQDMTASVCKNTNIWGQGTGTNAKVYAYNTADLSTSTEATPLASVTHDNDYLMNVGTFALVDDRDSNDYLVRRLADGNCWMVQNLDLNLGATNLPPLTPDNTDLHDRTWNPVTGLSSEYTTLGQEQYASGYKRGSANYWGSQYNEYIDNDTLAYVSDFDPATNPGAVITSKDANLGNHSYYPDGTRNTTATANGSLFIENNSRAQYPRAYDNGPNAMIAFYGVNKGSSTTRTFYNDPTSGTPLTSYANHITSGYYYANQGGTSASGETATYIDGTAIASGTVTDWLDYSPTRDSSKYGTMYVGDYYNWYAATAGSGTFAQTSGNATDSICPKGWSLPSDASGTTTSWTRLVNGTYFTNSETAYAKAEAMHLTPLSIPFSGDYNWVNGNLNVRGGIGYFWASTASSYPNAQYLYFNSTNVNPSNLNNKTYGLTVRCVAR